MTMMSFRSGSAALLRHFRNLWRIGRLFAAAAKRDVVRRLPLEQIRQLGWFLAVVEHLIERNLQSTRQFLERLDRRHGVAVLDTRDIAPQQSRPLLDITLRELLGFP